MRTSRLWTTWVIGYGTMHYVYASGREGDCAIIGLASNSDRSRCTSARRHPAEATWRSRTRTGCPRRTWKGCVRFTRLDQVDERAAGDGGGGLEVQAQSTRLSAAIIGGRRVATPRRRRPTPRSLRRGRRPARSPRHETGTAGRDRPDPSLGDSAARHTEGAALPEAGPGVPRRIGRNSPDRWGWRSGLRHAREEVALGVPAEINHVTDCGDVEHLPCPDVDDPQFE